MLGRKMRAALVNMTLSRKSGYWRPLCQTLVEELIPFLVLGTMGSDEMLDSGGSEAKAVESNILNVQTISNIPSK